MIGRFDTMKPKDNQSDREISMVCKVAACIVLSVTGTLAAQSWPTIQPQERRYHVGLPTAKSGIELAIRSREGSPVYTIECGTYATSKHGFDYSGEFECVLQTIPPDYTYSTYFTEDPQQSSDWESRARFFASEIADPCGQVPDFGRTRTFRLRGLKIILTMLNIIFKGQGSDL